jgi:hypothetical protein
MKEWLDFRFAGNQTGILPAWGQEIWPEIIPAKKITSTAKLLIFS